MLSVRILALGKIKEPYLRQGLDEYGKRLSSLCKLQIVELPDQKLPPNPGQAELEQLKNQEGQRILQALTAEEYLIALDLRGQELSSEQFADKLAQLALTGRSQLAFCIGASSGLSKEVLKRADLRLSFGALTYPHQLMRLILLEQIYRAFKINRGEPYHK